MNPHSEATPRTRFRVGIFTLLGLLLVGAISVFVNDRPFWWRPCELVHINIEDATGLKTKSPIRSLGIQIGYLKSVALSETHVRLGICITAPVEVLPSTRAFIRGEGFLGDKFVELKPVRYLGPIRPEDAPSPTSKNERSPLLQALLPEAHADETPMQKRTLAQEAAKGSASVRRGREIPVGERSQDVEHIMNQVDGLVEEMKKLTGNLKESFDPAEMKGAIQKLNKTLEAASRTLSPEGSLNTTAQRTLAKLEDAIEQFRDLSTRINRGEGSVGMLLNDPIYAQEIKKALENLNGLLNRVSNIRFVTEVAAVVLPAYDNGGRGGLELSIWPRPSRYFLVGFTTDPRGSRTVTTTETSTGGVTTVESKTVTEETALLLTVMFGKVVHPRIELSVGVLYGDGAVSTHFRLGPSGREEALVLRNDIYTRGSSGQGLDDRIQLKIQPFLGRHDMLSPFFINAGIDSTRKVNGRFDSFVGAGIRFDDDDIKLLFALR